MDLETLAYRFVEAFNMRQLEAELDLFDPGIELVPLRAELEDTVYRGHDGIRQLARDIAESWSQAHIEILDFEVRRERALSIGRLRLEGRLSGALTELTGAASWCGRNQRLFRMAMHTTVQEARRELGWEV
jgi:hypothetical protein